MEGEPVVGRRFSDAERSKRSGRKEGGGIAASIRRAIISVLGGYGRHNRADGRGARSMPISKG